MNIYEEYSKTKLALKALQLKLEELEPALLVELKGLAAPMKTDYGTFSTQTRVSYTYSPELQDFEKRQKQEIKTKQQQEIEQGTAEKKELLSVRFIENK